MPTSFLPTLPTFPGWFRSAYTPFEPRVQSARVTAAAPNIAIEDWDLLFRAALDILARETAPPTGHEMDIGKATCAGITTGLTTGLTTSITTGRVLQPPGTVLRECLVALDQLRRSVPRCTDTAARSQTPPAAP